MGRVWVHGADLEGDRIARLRVQLGKMEERVIDRDTTVAWMRDMHSFIVAGTDAALQLVEVDDEGLFVRDDTAPVAADKLPELPGA